MANGEEPFTATVVISAGGPAGPPGIAATADAGTTTTGSPGTNASVTNVGTTSAAVFNFTIPRGATGADGATGPAGPAGAGSGDVIGPGAVTTANHVVTWTDGTGTAIKDGGGVLSGSNTGDQTITLTGDVTGTGTGSFAATIANDAVTYAKMQNVSTTDRLLGRSTAGSGDVQEIVCTAAGRAILDDTAASDQRTTLGLGTLATQSGTFSGTHSGTSSGTNTGDQDLSVLQPLDTELTALAGTTSAADRLPYFTGSGTATTTTFTSAGRALIDDADNTAQRTTLGLAIGTDVQAYDVQLDSLSTLSYSGNSLKVVRVNAGETAFELGTPGGGGTVTAGGGSLTANSVVLGAGTTDTKVVTGITTDGSSVLTLGGNTTAAGLKINNVGNWAASVVNDSTNTAITTITLPAATTTLVGTGTTDSLTNKTFTGTANVVDSNGLKFNSTGNAAVTLKRGGGSGSTFTATLPEKTTTLVGTDTTDSLTNKTFDNSNVVDSTGLKFNSSGNAAITLLRGGGSGSTFTATLPEATTTLLGSTATGVQTFLTTPSSANLIAAVTDETGTGALVFANTPTLVTPILGTPTSGTLTNCSFPTLNQNSTGSAASLSVSGQTGLMTVTGLVSTNRIKTVRDAADTILELGGSYTPTGTWTSLTMVTPVLGTPASGLLNNCTATSTSTAWGIGTIELGHATDTTIARASAGRITVEGNPVLQAAPRVTQISSNATWSPNADTDDIYEITAQAVAVTTISNPSGTPVNGQKLTIRVLDNGTARAISGWGANYRFSSDLAAPTTTVLGKGLWMGFIYTTAGSVTKWDNVAQMNNF